MKTWKILVKGRVQKVGYRRIVDEIAYNLNITGHVKNLEDKKTVEVVAQHQDEKILKKFIELIKVNEYPIKVDHIETKEIHEKEFTSFEVIEGPIELENRESLEAGTIYLRRLAGEMKGMNGEMKGMHAEMKLTREELKHGMKDGFSETRKDIRDGFNEVSTNIKQTSAVTHGKLDQINVTLEKSVVSEIAEMKEKIAKIEQVLHIKS